MDNDRSSTKTGKSVNFVPCVKWVKRGVAKANPEKVTLTAEELETLINKTKEELGEAGEEVDIEVLEALKRRKPVGRADQSSDEEWVEDSETAGPSQERKQNPSDEFNFANYDKEKLATLNIGFAEVAVHGSSSKDPFITLPDDEDSDKEDDTIVPSDNLVLVGRVKGEMCALEIYVFNEDEDSLYVHHDFWLTSFPLCLEWLNHDPSEPKPGNLCAIGTMKPIIEVWDLDIMDCVEPAFELGTLPKKKKNIKRVGHKDAVLDLAWNTHFPHILASGSVDQTVLLWDLDKGSVASKFTPFNEKVQTLKWHPYEGQTLLTGSCDSVARVFDCRTENSFKEWQVGREVERVIWNHFDPFYFFAGTSEGKVYCIDCRSDTPVWQLGAHNEEVTGLSLSSQCPGLLVTASADGSTKVWDVAGSGGNDVPSFVCEKALSVGGIQCLDACPDVPFTFCVGGDKKSSGFAVFDITSEAFQRFGKRQLLRPVEKEESEDTNETPESTDTASEAAQAMESLTIRNKPFAPKKDILKKKNKALTKKIKKVYRK